MARKPLTTGERLAANAPAIMDAQGWRQLSEWAKASGLSYRALRYYMDLERSPTGDALDALANAAGITVPEMLTEGLTVEMVKQRDLATLTENYVSAAADEQAYVQGVLKRGKPRKSA